MEGGAAVGPVRYALRVDSLNRIYDQLDQRRIDIGARTNVLDQPPDVDSAHVKSPAEMGCRALPDRRGSGHRRSQ